ncbi:hypothetical protein A2U01_0084201, partial [Trifolium medium]|nr:hypothetical protein [Trifolium medium]
SVSTLKPCGWKAKLPKSEPCGFLSALLAESVGTLKPCGWKA